MGKVVKLRKIGDSYTISIPKSIAESFNWDLGDNLELTILGHNQLSISKK